MKPEFRLLRERTARATLLAMILSMILVPPAVSMPAEPYLLRDKQAMSNEFVGFLWVGVVVTAVSRAATLTVDLNGGAEHTDIPSAFDAG